MKSSTTFTRLLALAAFFCAASVIAQPTKRPIEHTDFDAWRTIATPVLSRDGKWLAYSVQPQDGDGDLVIRELVTGKERRESVGLLPPPMTAPNEENPDAPPVPRAIRVAFTSDSRFLVATTYASKIDAVAARKARKKPEEMPKGGLLIVNLAGGDVMRVPSVKSMQVPSRGGAWVAYLKEDGKADPAKADDALKAEPTVVSPPQAPPKDDQAAARRPASASTSSITPGAKRDYGTELVLRDLSAGTERKFANVLETSFARDGNMLLFTVSSKAETDNGIYMLATQDSAAPVALLAGKGKYVKLTWDREQTQAAFLSDRDDASAKVPTFKLYQWARGTLAAKEKLSSAIAGFPAGMTLSDKGERNTLAFSRDGKKLYVPVAPPGKPPRAPDSGPTDHDKVVADLWRWNDDLVQPMQKVRAAQERNRSFRGVFDLETSAYTQLGSDTLRTVSLSDDGRRAIGFDDRPYRRMVDYDGSYTDVYVVNAATGERKLAQKKLRSSTNLTQADWSPDGNWVIYFQNKHWHALNTADGTSKNLTHALGVAVHNEQHDAPAPAGAYGIGGWISDSTSLLIYDRFDVWQVYVDGRKAQNLTRGEGRKSTIRLRIQRIEPVDEDDDERGIDVSKPLVLRGESDETRASGFYRTTFASTAAPQRMIWADKNLRYIGRARDADVLLMTGSRFDTFPDLNTTDSNFANPTKVSDVGKQMSPFTWGTSELMSFTNAKGVPLKASVFKPDNFDASRKYPLMVYIYERVSQNVNNFVNPAPSNGLNAALYVSNGYVVLMPDIAYTTGEPGKSALDAVMPAIDKLVKQGFIDEKSIGIQGHSWGGYQVAWMVTQTNRFRAAEAGAPVGNMTSAYSGIRWGSGLPRQFQYEQSQSRIGKPLQEAPQLYIANSPVFHVKKIQTPLLLLANDADDAVPWYQGIEMFLAMRRYQKEAYLFNYNGQLHNLRRRADQKDFALRMHQFFDHFLKGAAKPAWMENGISYLDREDEKEQFGKPQSAPVESAK